MKFGEMSRALVGGAVVYAAMAACSASDSGPATSMQTPDGGQAGHEGSIGAGGAVDDAAGNPDGHADGSLLDALTDPVPDALADSPPASGSRLKAKYRVGDDGSREKLLNQWHDSQLGEDCSFQGAADGAIRCIPSTTQIILPFYADPACTQRLVMVSSLGEGCPDPAAPKRASAYLGCGATSIHVYGVGAEFTSETLYSLSGTTCTAIAASTYPAWKWYSVLDEIPASTFVGSHVETDP